MMSTEEHQSGTSFSQPSHKQKPGKINFSFE